MLAFTRKEGDRIHIGRDVTLFIVKIQGNRVKVAIKAPREVDVHRGETFDAIERSAGRAPE